MPRQAGKLGRKPFNPEVKHLILEKYLDPRSELRASALPAVPVTEDVDRSSRIQNWPMYLNDRLGCCTIAGAGHLFEATSAYAGTSEGGALFTNDTIEKTYSAIGGYVPGNQDSDQGCLMVDVLSYLQSIGMQDETGKTHKVLGYARFGNPADVTLLGQVLEVFGSVYTGFNVQESIQTEFAHEQPWTYTPGEPYVGGHCVTLQRRLGEGSAPFEYVTWGATTEADYSWLANTVEEAWVVVSEDWVRANGTTIDGMDVQQLLSDMQYV